MATCSSPVRHVRSPKEPPFDLHALGTPPALILSQDQTLHQCVTSPRSAAVPRPVLPPAALQGFRVTTIGSVSDFRSISWLPADESRRGSTLPPGCPGSADRLWHVLGAQTPSFSHSTSTVSGQGHCSVFRTQVFPLVTSPGRPRAASPVQLAPPQVHVTVTTSLRPSRPQCLLVKVPSSSLAGMKIALHCCRAEIACPGCYRSAPRLFDRRFATCDLLDQLTLASRLTGVSYQRTASLAGPFGFVK